MVLIVDALAVIGSETQDDWVDAPAFGGTQTKLQSYALLNADYSPDLYVGAWVLLPEREYPNRERRVELYIPSSAVANDTGTVQWPSFALGNAVPRVAPTERFQVWTSWRPSDVELALLRALRDMFLVRVAYLTGAQIDGLRQINLTAAISWLASPNQVIAVTVLDGTYPAAAEAVAGGVVTYQDANGADAPSGVYLNAQADQVFRATDTIAVYTWRDWRSSTSSFPKDYQPGDLSIGTTFAPVEWWAKEAMYILSRQSQYRNPELETRMIGELNRLRPMYQPESGYRGILPRESWGVDGRNGW